MRLPRLPRLVSFPGFGSFSRFQALPGNAALEAPPLGSSYRRQSFPGRFLASVWEQKESEEL